jgi:hypothetical protein
MEIIFEKSDVYGGFAPVAGATLLRWRYITSLKSGLSHCAPPNGGLIGARGGIFLLEKQFSPKLM